MTNYILNNFKNGKAFIYQEKCINGEVVIGNRICIDTKGNKLFELPEVGMIVNEFEDEDIAFVMNYDSQYALLDNKGKFLTEFIYNNISRNSDEGLFYATKNGKHGYIDIRGNEIIPFIYECCNAFSEGLTAVKLDEKWGMVDFLNNTVIPFDYDDITICYNNIIAAQKDGKWGLINKQNEILVDFQFDLIDNWASKKSYTYPAMLNNKYGLIDRQGNILEEFIYDYIDVISDTDDIIGEYLRFEKDNKCALYSTRRKTFLTEFIYDDIEFCYENKLCVTLDNKIGFIDINGEVITPIIYDSSSTFYNEGFVAVQENGLHGALDSTGKEVIPCEYRFLGNFNEGIACATNQERQEGYIDKNDNTVIPFGKYRSCSDFHCGLAKVFDKELGQVYINKQDEVLKIKV